MSVAAHFVVVFGLWVSGMWKLERMEAGQRPFDLAVAPQPPEDSGSPAGSPAPKLKLKTHKETPKEIVKEPVQPTETKPPDVTPAVTAANTSDTGTGNGSGSGTGSGSGMGTGSGTGSGAGSGSGDHVIADDPCVLDPGSCTKVVPPTVIRGLRISGETQIHPPDLVKTEILRDGKTQVIASFRVCIGTHGEISTLALAKSSGYKGYDAALTAGLRDWRYKPYLLDNRPMPVCGMVTFIYALH